ncbi:hypothetical protein [Kocuria flava]|uniref:hypothetical protein n=1 Tax=Kocuria flava TaxID=446860 RepID=UPI0021508F3B|nr:hypothetical protein [Kocuria flava]
MASAAAAAVAPTTDQRGAMPSSRTDWNSASPVSVSTEAAHAVAAPTRPHCGISHRFRATATASAADLFISCHRLRPAISSSDCTPPAETASSIAEAITTMAG